MNLTEVLLAVILILVVLPYMVYTCVKMGVYAFYRGQQLFKQHEETKRHGKGKT